MFGGGYFLPAPPLLPELHLSLPLKSTAQPICPLLIRGELRSSASIACPGIQVDSVPGFTPDDCSPETAGEPVCSAGRL